VSDFLAVFCCFINIKTIVSPNGNCHHLLSQVVLNPNKFLSSVENKLFGKMWLTKQLLYTSDFHSIFEHKKEINAGLEQH